MASPPIARRTFIAVGAAAAGAMLSTTHAAAQGAGTPARTFLLVHGAYHGGWCWSRVAARLSAAGHRVIAPSLTGMGDRVHLSNPAITLDTHIRDIANIIEYEELERVVLVGHSYGGIVITGVADRVAARLGRLVYLDAIVLRDGESWSTYHAPERRAALQALARANNNTWPKSKADAFGITDALDKAWVDRHLTSFPHGPYEGTVRVGEAWRKLGKTYIDCTQPAFTALSVWKDAIKKDLANKHHDWRYHTLATGHDAMVTQPGPLAELLLAEA